LENPQFFNQINIGSGKFATQYFEPKFIKRLSFYKIFLTRWIKINPNPKCDSY
jgi:hypothetical protein